jgi:hypothetical protein
MLTDAKCSDAKSNKDTSQAIDSEVEYPVHESNCPSLHVATVLSRVGFVRNDDAPVEPAECEDHAYLTKAHEQTSNKVQFYLDRQDLFR